MQRKYLWDNLKFLLICLVVLGHYIDYYTDGSLNMRRLYIFITMFHMPAFIFVSGLFSKKIINEKRWNKVLDYFIMYIFIKGILLICDRINGGGRSFWLFEADGVEWYAFAVMMFLIITIVVHRINPAFVFLFSIFVGCLSGYHSADGDFLVIQRILVFYPFFFLGYLLNPDKVETYTRKKPFKIISVVILIFTIGVIYRYIEKLYILRPLLTGRNPYSKLESFEMFGGLLRGGYYVYVFIFIFAIVALVPVSKSVISVWGSHTLSVYTLHRAVIYFFMGMAGGRKLIDIYFPGHPGVILVPAAVITTILFSLPFWDKLLQPILHPKWHW